MKRLLRARSKQVLKTAIKVIALTFPSGTESSGLIVWFEDFSAIASLLYICQKVVNEISNEIALFLQREVTSI